LLKELLAKDAAAQLSALNLRTIVVHMLWQQVGAQGDGLGLL
jgi:hypothetical protein